MPSSDAEASNRTTESADHEESHGAVARPGHALVVGGTGMLAGVSLALAERGRVVTVIARNPSRLSRLEDAARRFSGAIRPLPLDYRNDPALVEGLARSQERNGAFRLVVCWAHATAPRAVRIVADSIRAGGGECAFYHVLGSAGTDPPVPDPERVALFSGRTDIRYRAVILGFVRKDGFSRWLTNEEIVDGVLDAIELDAPRHLVGTVQPWDLRP